MSSKRTVKNDMILIKEMMMEKEERKNQKNNKSTEAPNKYKLLIDNEKIEIKNNVKDKIKNICKYNNLKKNLKKIKIPKKVLINVGAIFYNLLAFLFYYLSLEGCFLTQSECIPLLSTVFLVRLLAFGITFSLMMAIEIFLIISRTIYIFHVIYIVIFYIVIYQYDNGSKLDHHGLYNFGLSLMLIVIFTIIIGIIYLITFLKRKKNIYYWAIFIIVFGYISIKILIFSLSFKNTCKDWDKGLNSTRIDNSHDEYSCDMIYPKKCLIYNLNDFFDVSFYIGKKCSIKDKQQTEHNIFIKYLNLDKNLTSISKMTHFGLPITVNNPNFTMKDPRNYLNVHKYVYSNTILMDLYNENKTKYYNNTQQPEVEIFYNKKTKIRSAKMKLIKNETLSKQRNKISLNAKKTNNSLYDNIMVIYIDCISRQHFLRKMKKTASFIERFMKYDNNLGFNSYQFMKYQTFAHWTTPNVMPMFYSSRNPEGRRVNVIKYMKDNGYVTGNSGNLCSKESFGFDYEDRSNYDIILDEYDHENIAMFCDPNYSSEDSPYPLITGPYGIIRKCLYGLDTFKYLLEFANQFWKLYPKNKRYLRLSFQDGHEPTGQVVKYMDEDLYNFLNNLYEEKLLNDTAIFILSDHGNSYFNYIYYYIFKSDDSLIERTYGTLFMILPSNKKKKIYWDYYNNNVYINQQILISPYDIHDTLIHIVFGNNTSFNREVYSHRGNSLLSKFDGKSRNCSTWEGSIVDTECLCKK